MSKSPFNIDPDPKQGLNEHEVDFSNFAPKPMPEFEPDERDIQISYKMIKYVFDKMGAADGDAKGAFECFIAIKVLVDTILHTTMAGVVPEVESVTPMELGAILEAAAANGMAMAESREQAERMAREAAEVLVDALVATAKQEAMIQVLADRIWHFAQQSKG